MQSWARLLTKGYHSLSEHILINEQLMKGQEANGAQPGGHGPKITWYQPCTSFFFGREDTIGLIQRGVKAEGQLPEVTSLPRIGFWKWIGVLSDHCQMYMWSLLCFPLLLIARHIPHNGSHNLPLSTATNISIKGLHFSLYHLAMSFSSDIGPALMSFK